MNPLSLRQSISVYINQFLLAEELCRKYIMESYYVYLYETLVHTYYPRFK